MIKEIQFFENKVYASLATCWWSNDGTVRPCCRPCINQRTVYKRHKRVDRVKFRSVVTLIGLIANLFGPVAWSKYNSAEAVTRRCSVKKDLIRNFAKIHRKTYLPESLFW